MPSCRRDDEPIIFILYVWVAFGVRGISRDTVRLPDIVELVPALELEPWNYFEAATLPRPDARSQSREEWRRYHEACLEGAGLGALPRIAGTWLVALDDLCGEQPLALRRHVERPLDHRKARDIDPEHVGAALGGYALVSRAGVHVTPTCCCDLGSIEDWEGVATSPTEAGSTLWIGHPWRSARRKGDSLLFSVPHEDEREPRVDFTVRLDSLRQAIEVAKVALRRFEATLVRIVREIAPSSDVHAIARALMGRANEP